MRPDKLFQTWAFTLLMGGIVVPVTATTITYAINYSEKIHKAKVQGCLNALRRGGGTAVIINCDEINK